MILTLPAGGSAHSLRVVHPRACCLLGRVRRPLDGALARFLKHEKERTAAEDRLQHSCKDKGSEGKAGKFKIELR